MTKTLTQLGSSTFINDPDLLLKRDDASGDDKKVTVGEAFASQREVRQINVGGSSDYTLTVGDTGKELIELIGTLTNSINVIAPDEQRKYTVLNSTAGGFTITVKTSTGTGIVVPTGLSTQLRCDGANIVGSVNYGTMPTVAGDPIVESGSNSDGEWSRFANGLQFCYEENGASATTSVNVITDYYTTDRFDVVFPMPFVSAPSMFSGPTDANSNHGFSQNFVAVTATGAGSRGYGVTNSQAIKRNFNAIGYWK